MAAVVVVVLQVLLESTRVDAPAADWKGAEPRWADLVVDAGRLAAQGAELVGMMDTVVVAVEAELAFVEWAGRVKGHSSESLGAELEPGKILDILDLWAELGIELEVEPGTLDIPKWAEPGVVVLPEPPELEMLHIQ